MTIRGTVTIVRPVLYVQDPSGAILLKPDEPVGPVKVGDEVEAQGVLSNDSVTPELNHASIQLRWPDSPILPIVVTPFELAAGRNTGRFVETDGILLSQSIAANRSLLLRMENDSQEFYVIAGDGNDASSNSAFQSWKPATPARCCHFRCSVYQQPGAIRNSCSFFVECSGDWAATMVDAGFTRCLFWCCSCCSPALFTCLSVTCSVGATRSFCANVNE